MLIFTVVVGAVCLTAGWCIEEYEPHSKAKAVSWLYGIGFAFVVLAMIL
jgi:hypothetical protein